MNYDIGETISIAPDYIMSNKDREIVREITKKMHGLIFENYSDNKSLWISDDEVKGYLQQLYRLYGGKFRLKGGIIDFKTFNAWRIPVQFLDMPKCVKESRCSTYGCIYYENELKK